MKKRDAETKRPQIILDGDDYDALHLTALAFGDRIGAGMCFDWDDSSYAPVAPCCIHGHAYMAVGNGFSEDAISVRLRAAGLYAEVNDSVTTATDRITFAEFCRRANVVPDYAVTDA